MPEYQPLPERIENDDGLLLRRWLPSDAEALARAVAESDAHLRPWMPWMAAEPSPLEQRRALLAEWGRDWAQGGDVALGIFQGEEIVGSTGYRRRIGPGGLEIGYWVHVGHTGRGLATAASRLLTETAFTIPGITHVQIHHDRANVRSGAVPRRLGFRLVAEVQRAPEAPAEVGIQLQWRMTDADWRDGAGAGS